MNYQDEAEADFQEVYGIDLMRGIEEDFPRMSRLFLQLPPQARVFTKIQPANEWSWDKEVQSRILAKLDIISTQLANMFKKKGEKAIKPEKQFQPKFVEEAKEESERRRQEKNKFSEDELAKLKDFWKKKNPNARYLDTGQERA